MAKVFLNENVLLDKQGQIWEAKNGSTRRTLLLVNKLNEEPGNVCRANVGTLNKGNHSFIFLNEEKGEDERILGIFLNSNCGYKVLQGKEIFGNYSDGGSGNSRSQFGVYQLGALIEVQTYKNRTTPEYYRLTDSGWVSVPVEEVFVEEIEEI